MKAAPVWGTIAIALLLSRPSGAAIRFDPPVYYPHEGLEGTVALGDFNADGKLDMLVAATPPSPGWVVRLGNGDGTFGPPLVFPLNDGAVGIAAADVNLDGRDDMASCGFAGLTILVSKGDGTFEPPVQYPLEVIGFDLEVGDLDNDGDPDVVASQNNRRLAVFLGNGDGSFNRIPDVTVAREAAVLALADFTGEGDLDIACGYQVSFSSFNFLRGRGDGSFDPMVFIPNKIPGQESVMRAVDLNGDGLLDLLTTQSPFEAIGILLASAPGIWEPETLVPTTGAVHDLAVADFDLDGRPDIVFTNAPLHVRVRRGNGDGTFSADLIEWQLGGPVAMPYQIAVGDLNGDGLPDLIYADHDEDPFGRPRTAVVLNRSGNQPPLADAGPDGLFECSSPAGTAVALDGSASSDPDSTPAANDIARYEWFEDYGTPSQALIATGEMATAVLGPSDHLVTLVVTDTAGEQATDDVVASVRDTTPPSLAVQVFPSLLWPPNHKLRRVQVLLTADDACDGTPPVRLVAVSSSEPDDAPGGGDGHTNGDVQGASLGTPDTEVFLRAERAGTGSGRVYRLTYEATDLAGNVVQASAEVRVPHDLGGAKLPAAKLEP